VQFQYLALVRYCQNVHATRKPLQDALTQAEQKLTSIQDLTSKEHAKMLTLQQENQSLKDTKQKYDNTKAELERLQNIEREVEQYRRLDVNPKDLETFKNNKDAIRHYLKLVPTLTEYAVLQLLRNRLTSFQAKQQDAQATRLTRICHGARTCSQSQGLRFERIE
jgi:hypothetical protein